MFIIDKLTNMTPLKARVEELMSVTGWSIAAVARASKVSHSAVSQWLGRGNTLTETMNSTAAANLAEASGFNANWLATGKGPRHAGVSPNSNLQISDQLAVPVTGQNHVTFEQALDTLVKAVQATDDLTRDQIKPLINRMFDEPARAAEIAARISAAVSSGSAGTPHTTTTKVGNEEMPSFLKR